MMIVPGASFVLSATVVRRSRSGSPLELFAPPAESSGAVAVSSDGNADSGAEAKLSACALAGLERANGAKQKTPVTMSALAIVARCLRAGRSVCSGRCDMICPVFAAHQEMRVTHTNAGTRAGFLWRMRPYCRCQEFGN